MDPQSCSHCSVPAVILLQFETLATGVHSHDHNLQLSQLASDKQNQLASCQVTSCGHMMLHIMTHGELLNSCKWNLHKSQQLC